MAGNSGQPGRSVTGRALAVLGAFDLGHPSLSLSEIARRADLPLATAHRLVADLEAWGAVERDTEGQYQVGRRLWEIGMLWPSYARMRELAVPFMQDLYEATRENVHVAVRVGYEALYLEKLTGHRSVPIISRSGSRLPMHATGVGKALLAYGPAEFVAAYVDRPLERPTPYTIVEAGRLARDLAEVRERGYAVTREEMTLGSCSVATPVREDGVAVAALGLVVHSVRADVDRLVPALRRATAGLERRLAETADDPYPGLVHDFPRVQARRRH
jgi:DNA-binding IclR family transcriptional regulator